MAFPGWQLLRNRVLGNVFGFAAGTAAADAFRPPLRDVAAELEHAFGLTRRLSPQELAELVVRGARDEGEGAAEAGDWGINPHRFHELYLLAGNPPGPETLLDLWNRGAIDEGRVELGVRQGRIRTEWLGPLKELRQRLLTPAELAEGAARGLEGGAEAQREAARLGLSAARFELLERLSARPPAAGQLLDLLNRGTINEGRARDGLRDAGIRAEWADDVLELRRYLIPPSDLIRLAVREVYSPAIRERFGLDEDFPTEFASRAARLGISRQDAGDLWAGHWDLPSPQQGFSMLHRGIITRPLLLLLLRALDVMPFWRQRLVELAYRVPGRIDLRRMFRFGVIDRARLVRGYLDLGYAPADAELLAKFAQREKLAPERDLSKAEVLQLVELGSMGRDAAVRELDRLGYDRTEAGLLLGIAEARRARARREAIARAVRARFLDRELTADEARLRLRDAQLPQDEIDRRVELWTFELAENPRHITEAQMRAAWRGGLVDEGRYRRHLAQLGYPDDEAGILVRLYSQPA